MARTSKSTGPSTFNSSKKIGLQGLSAMEKSKLAKNYYARRDPLTIPVDIQAAHPDKQFAYLNYAKLEQNSFWNPNGWTVFKGDADTEGMEKEKFGADTVNGLVRRNEMVMAWMPKDQYEQQQLEMLAARDAQNLSNIITHRGELSQFHPHAKVTLEQDDLMQR